MAGGGARRIDGGVYRGSVDGAVKDAVARGEGGELGVVGRLAELGTGGILRGQLGTNREGRSIN